METVETVVEAFLAEVTRAMKGKPKRSLDNVWESLDKSKFLDKLYSAVYNTLRHDGPRISEAHRAVCEKSVQQQETLIVVDEAAQLPPPVFPSDVDTLLASLTPASPPPAPKSDPPPAEVRRFAGAILTEPPPPPPPAAAAAPRPDASAEVRRFADAFLADLDTRSGKRAKATCEACIINDPSQHHHACMMGTDYRYWFQDVFSFVWSELDVANLMSQMKDLWTTLNSKTSKKRKLTFGPIAL